MKRYMLHDVGMVVLFLYTGMLSASAVELQVDRDHKKSTLSHHFLNWYSKIPDVIGEVIESYGSLRLDTAACGYIGGWEGEILKDDKVQFITDMGDLIVRRKKKKGVLSFYKHSPLIVSCVPLTIRTPGVSVVEEKWWEMIKDTAGLLIMAPTLSKYDDAWRYYRVDQEKKHSASFMNMAESGVVKKGFIPVSIPGKGGAVYAGYYTPRPRDGHIMVRSDQALQWQEQLSFFMRGEPDVEAKCVRAVAHPTAPFLYAQAHMNSDGDYGPQLKGILLELDSQGKGKPILHWEQEDRDPNAIFFDTHTDIPRYFEVSVLERKGRDFVFVTVERRSLYKRRGTPHLWELPTYGDAYNSTFYPPTDFERTAGIACVAMQGEYDERHPFTYLLHLLEEDGKVKEIRKLCGNGEHLLSNDHCYATLITGPGSDDKEQEALRRAQVFHTRFNPYAVQSPLAYALIVSLYAASASLGSVEFS